MSDGWIKIHRKFLEWEWYDKSEMVHLFLHLLLNASVSNKRWHNTPVNRGQLITGRKRLSDETGISQQTVRTCLQRLVETGEIEITPTNKFSIITICNYDSYQIIAGEDNQEPTNDEPTNNQPPKPKKTKEEVKADTERRMKEFYNSLVPYVKTYGKEMVRAFYDYWSETNKSGSKMKWEQEPTWVLEKRLQRWANNDKSYNTKSNGIDNRKSNPTAEQRTADAAGNIASFILGRHSQTDDVD